MLTKLLGGWSIGSDPGSWNLDHRIWIIMNRPSIYLLEYQNGHLGNGLGAMRPSGPARERCNVLMDPQNLGYPPSPPLFASFAFACRREKEW